MQIWELVNEAVFWSSALLLLKATVWMALGFVELWQVAGRLTVWHWLAVVWVAETLLLWVRLALGLAQVSAVAREAEPADNPWVLEVLRSAARELGLGVDPRLAYSSRVGTPILWGWRRPLLIIPEASIEWETDRLRVVFVHELAHFRRRDSLTLLLGKMVASLYWFHPLAWWVESACRSYSEAFRLGYKPGVSLYNLACGYALLNQSDLAFDYLARAIEAGFSNWGHLEDDEDLRSLRADARFQEYREQFRKHKVHEHKLEMKRHKRERKLREKQQ